MKELLNQTQAGVHILNKEKLRDYLFKSYHGYEEFGTVKYPGMDTGVRRSALLLIHPGSPVPMPATTIPGEQVRKSISMSSSNQLKTKKYAAAANRWRGR